MGILTRHEIRELLSQAKVILEASGSGTPLLDAEVLLSFVLDCGRFDLYTREFSRDAKTLERRFFTLVKRRAQGEPISHITGVKEFWSREFLVSKDCLIPRPETELVVEEALKFLLSIPQKKVRVLDLGTGTGCIAITLFLEAISLGKTPVVVASDISLKALEVAKKNIKRFGLESQIALFRGDWACAIRKNAFDLIVSNPPYVKEVGEMGLDRSVFDFEPHLALFGGSDGLSHIKTIIHQGQEVLGPNGAMVLEIGDGQKEPLDGWIHESHIDFREIVFSRDLSGIYRVVVLKK